MTFLWIGFVIVISAVVCFAVLMNDNKKKLFKEAGAKHETND